MVRKDFALYTPYGISLPARDALLELDQHLGGKCVPSLVRIPSYQRIISVIGTEIVIVNSCVGIEFTSTTRYVGDISRGSIFTGPID
jgi:hypothetical protein